MLFQEEVNKDSDSMRQDIPQALLGNEISFYDSESKQLNKTQTTVYVRSSLLIFVVSVPILVPPVAILCLANKGLQNII